MSSHRVTGATPEDVALSATKAIMQAVAELRPTLVQVPPSAAEGNTDGRLGDHWIDISTDTHVHIYEKSLSSNELPQWRELLSMVAGGPTILEPNVGIGTDDPQNLLHLYTNTTFLETRLTTDDAVPLIIEQDGTGDAALQFQLTGTKRWAIGINNVEASDSFVIVDGITTKFMIQGSTNYVITTDLSVSNELSLGALTASRLLSLGATNLVASVADLTSWVAGTANRVTVADDGDGTITLSGPQDIHTAASPTFAGLMLSGLTASRLMATGALSVAASVADLTSWVAGTANRVTVADDGDGTITLSGPQDIHTTASPTFANLTMGTGGALRTGTGVGDTLLLRAYDTDTGPAYTTFATLTAGLAPTMDLSTSVTVGGSAIQVGVTWGDGLAYAAPTASIDYNATNLKITAAQIDTVQSIATGASPTFVALSLSGLLDVRKGNDEGIRLWSNNAAQFTYINLGRAAKDASVGVAGGNNQFFTGAVAGDVVIKGETSNKIHLGIGDAAPTLTVILNRAGVGVTAPLGTVDVAQVSSTGAIPVLKLAQSDVSEEFVRFVGTSANAVLTQSIVEAADVGTATVAGYVKVYVQDDGNQLTDQPYYLPVYTLA